MGNRLNRMKSKRNKEEAYKYGYDVGFGTAFGMCIGFMRKKGIDYTELKEYILKRKYGE